MKNKLLYFNLAIDEHDTSLGFATKWIETIASNYDQVDVVTLKKVTNIKFSENIKIYGPNEKTNKFNKYLVLLQQVKILTKENSYNRCFSHMSPISIFVSSYFLLKNNIKTTLWFTHPGPRFGLKKIILFLSMLISEYIVTASPSSFPFKNKKVKIIGHAIDLEQFNFNREAFQIRKFLILSRISESKSLEIAIESFLKSKFNNYKLDIIGGPLNKADEDYFSSLKDKYENKNIKFLGKIKHGELPGKLLEYDVHFNCARDGFFDKSILETLSCEIINFYKNKDFNNIFGNDFFNFTNSEDLVMKLNQLSRHDNEEIYFRLKNIKSQLQKNSLKTLNKRLVDYL
jgi:glycosyltransferase involved in cell wall biosynthesis